MLSFQIKATIIIFILSFFVNCTAKIETTPKDTIRNNTPEVIAENKGGGKVTILHLGRDTYRAKVKSSFLNNLVNLRQDVEQQAILFCQEKKSRFRSLDWTQQNNGYRLDFRCL